MAVDADLAGRAAGRQVQAAGIDDTVGMLQFAAQRNCQPAVLCFHGIDRSFGRAADGEKTLPVWQLDQLRQQYAGRAKGNMDVPDRAGATIFGNRERRSVEPLGHVARLVDAQKEERYAAPSVTLQGCQALGCLFDGYSKGSSQPVEVVAGLLCLVEKGIIGHQEGGCKIVGKLYMTPRGMGVAGKTGGIGDGGKHVREFNETERMGQLKGAVLMIERL